MHVLSIDPNMQPVQQSCLILHEMFFINVRTHLADNFLPKVAVRKLVMKVAVERDYLNTGSNLSLFIIEEMNILISDFDNIIGQQRKKLFFMRWSASR